MNFIGKSVASLSLALAVTLFGAGDSQAAVVVDPAVGGTYDFEWVDGLGPIDGIDFGSETEWSITVAVDSILSLVAAEDKFIPGDKFELVFDGAVLAWDSETTLGGGHFLGEISSLFLSAGVHTFSLNVTELALNTFGNPFLSGGAKMTFGYATPAVSPVPLPAGLPMVLSAFGALGFLRLRRGRRKPA